MDRRLLGILLVAASLYYIYRKDAVASPAAQSQLDYIPATPFDNANSSGIPVVSNQIDYTNDDHEEIVRDSYQEYFQDTGLGGLA